MQVKVKPLTPTAHIPTYAHSTDACFDLYADSITTDAVGNIVYGTGLAFELPDGHYMQLQPRSSNTAKDLVLLNSPGIVDSAYRGEVTFKYRFIGRGPLDTSRIYQLGDRIGQGMILPVPHIEFVPADTISDTDRGTGGYGSTGK